MRAGCDDGTHRVAKDDATGVCAAPRSISRSTSARPSLRWLIRITPPTPRSEIFPAVRFLLGLHATEETPARTPPWLLALRLMAAGLVILALARPVLDAGAALAGRGPLLLVIDNGWASASDSLHVSPNTDPSHGAKKNPR